MGENISVILATKGGLRTDVCSSDLNYIKALLNENKHLELRPG